MTDAAQGGRTAHDFTVQAADGNQVSLGDYAGKVLLVVNVASKCGLTPQYEGLETLYREEKDKGLEVLGFPCNQFMGQEPGTDEEIQDFCRTSYDVTFPVFAKIDVNGPDAHPLYEFLREQVPGDIAWNFEKFLVGREGQVIKRWEPQTTPEEIRDEVRQHL
ncbi:MAG TPA: glutathione peroxidase [Nocardioides sp.]|nr:glutathione peroxidase [Nocardioides sp.]